MVRRLINVPRLKAKIESASPNVLVNYVGLSLSLSQSSGGSGDRFVDFVHLFEGNLAKIRRASNVTDLEVKLYRCCRRLYKVGWGRVRVCDLVQGRSYLDSLRLIQALCSLVQTAENRESYLLYLASRDEPSHQSVV